MVVADVMSRDVEFIDASASVQSAAELMGEIEVGALPVGNAAKLDGIVTDRDILYRLVARGLDPVTTTVRDIMSRPVIGCGSQDSVHQAMDAMASNHIRRMPVLGPAGELVGWLTLADLSRHLLVENAALQSALQGLTEAK